MKHWEILKATTVYRDSPWVHLKKLIVKLPNHHVIPNFYRMECGDYTAVIAFTPDRRLVLGEQLKLGVGFPSLVFPGGGVDKGETPLQAAKRELREETGYTAARWTYLGNYVQDANRFLSNAHFFVAFDAVKTHEPRIDPTEESKTILKTVNQAWRAFQKGQFRLVATVTALLLAKHIAAKWNRGKGRARG